MSQKQNSDLGRYVGRMDDLPQLFLVGRIVPIVTVISYLDGLS